MWMVILGFAAVIGWFTYVGYQRAVSVDHAKAHYTDALARLKAQPTDPDLKLTALAAGRAYAAIARDDAGDPLFDEVSLMNDINAVCAGAASIDSAAVGGSDVETRLRNLNSLKEGGLISDSEYEARRAAIIERI